MSSPDPHLAMAMLREVLEADGLEAGLAYLNRRVEHRFTGIFRLEKLALRNVAMADKKGEMVAEAFEVVPVNDSFCQFVLRDGFFRTAESSGDARLDGHSAKGVVESYVGVPLSVKGNHLYGTLCHFDFLSRKLPDEEFSFLQQAAQVIPEFIK